VAKIINASGNEMLQAMVYGRLSNRDIQYLEDNKNRVSTYFEDEEYSFGDTYKRIYEDRHGRESADRVRNVLRKADSVVSTILKEYNYDKLHTANMRTKKFIMLDPEVRRQVMSGLLHGFDETYIDPYKNATEYPWWDKEHMEAFNGVSTDGVDIRGVLYGGYNRRSEEVMDMDVAMTIIRIRRACREAICNEIDPTDDREEDK